MDNVLVILTAISFIYNCKKLLGILVPIFKSRNWNVKNVKNFITAIIKFIFNCIPIIINPKKPTRFLGLTKI